MSKLRNPKYMNYYFKNHKYVLVLSLTALAAMAQPLRAQSDNKVTVPLSDPSRPVNLRAHLVSGVDGEFDINDVNGEVDLKNIGGSVVAHALNGHVLVTFNRIDPQKPMAFSSLNGDIDVTFPADLKANVSLRTDNGEVYSDFD